MIKFKIELSVDKDDDTELLDCDLKCFMLNSKDEELGNVDIKAQVGNHQDLARLTGSALQVLIDKTLEMAEMKQSDSIIDLSSDNSKLH